MRNRSWRRHHDRRSKARAQRIMRLWFRNPVCDPVEVGRNAAVHCCGCSCWMCRFHEEPALRDRRLLLNFHEAEAMISLTGTNVHRSLVSDLPHL
jgi:hypothetical protein